MSAGKRNKDGLTRCRMCGCTAVDACLAGCSWEDDDLCSVCSAAVDSMAAWLVECRRPNKTALWREVVAKLTRET